MILIKIIKWFFGKHHVQPVPKLKKIVALSSIPTKSKLSLHFSRSELECHCGCGMLDVKNVPIIMLEELRRYIRKPLISHCCARCPVHNAKVGGVPNSYHIKSMAWDGHAQGMSIKELHKICKALWRKKYILTGGLGEYSWGVHIDNGPRRKWTEKQKAKLVKKMKKKKMKARKKSKGAKK